MTEKARLPFLARVWNQGNTTTSAAYVVTVYTTWKVVPPDPFGPVREPRRPLPNPASPSVALEEPC